MQRHHYMKALTRGMAWRKFGENVALHCDKKGERMMEAADSLKKELNVKEKKLRKLEKLTAEIETVKEDISALRRSLQIIGSPVSVSVGSDNSVSPETN